jgi:hypothetical protein
MEKVSLNCLCTTTKVGEALGGQSCPGYIFFILKIREPAMDFMKRLARRAAKKDLSGVGRPICMFFKSLDRGAGWLFLC